MKPILSLDFDGVLHSYTSGWKGAAVVTDPPVDGMVSFLLEAVKHFDVCVFSSRSLEPGGIVAMRGWLLRWASVELGKHAAENLLKEIRFPIQKPPAFVGLDDKVITFKGTWPTVESLKRFRAWNEA